MDLSKAQRELDVLFERLFASPRDPDATFGHITEYDCVTQDFEVHEELGG